MASGPALAVPGVMKPILILYATREGQTRRIAEHLAATLRARDIDADVQNVENPSTPDFGAYSAAVVAASLHLGKYESEMVSFVREHRVALTNMHTAFLSVSLTEADVENTAHSPEKRAHAREELQRTIDDFMHRTGWHPERIQPVAGALAYTQYGLLKRFVMQRIARSKGTSTDTSRDHVYTDWTALEQFTNSLADSLETERGRP